MARITVQDCLEKVDNRFHLVRVASEESKAIHEWQRAISGMG